MKLFGAFLLGIIAFAIGVYFVIYPEKMQKQALKSYEGNKVLQKLNPFMRIMKKGTYITQLRIMGAVIICLALIIFCVILFVHPRST